jgi:ketosteroid isomerase-like protein
MKKLVLVIPSVFLLGFTFGCQQGEEVAEEPAVDVAADVAVIKALLLNNESVLSSEDLDGWIDQFTEYAIFMRPEVEILKGKEAGRESVRSWFEQSDMETSISVDEIKVLGDWAFARWSFEFQYTPKSGGDTTQRNGKEIWILKRQPDGSWKCSHIIYNYDSPPPPPKEE